jgi:Mlc titration factor MtfA (ptsG expression regulator)
VRIDRPQDRSLARLVGAMIIIASLGLGAAFQALPGVIGGALFGLTLALVLARLLARRGVRRRATLASPIPPAWREFLATHYDHYERLPTELRTRFEDDVRILVAETRITGVGVEVTDALRLLVAASAATLSLGWPDYEWDQLTEVLLYPDEFDRDYRLTDDPLFGRDDMADEPDPGGIVLSGQTHPWGTVILSVPTLVESFADADDGYHVGLHEFAHLLDVDRTHFDGIPVGLDAARSREWMAVMEKEMERLRKGKSALDSYGSDSPVEFLAVAVEAFFEMPLVVRQRHREVYAILSAYFGQDPAAWDDARGPVM